MLEVMNFLNEVVERFPDAVSFAPGRPREELFDVSGCVDQLTLFASHRAAAEGASESAILARLGQYGPTGGVIRDLVARHLELDENIRVAPESILVTCGCQEAMAILAMALFDPARDVLLVSDPTYIGITGLATILEVEMRPVASGPDGLETAKVQAAIDAVRAEGRNPRALYDIPDFNNPLGTTLPVSVRRELLDLARREEILLIEDNPYGMFAYDGERAPTLKALDDPDDPVVIYLGSFAKTLFPGLRIGYLVADQPTENGLLAAALSRVKSLTTVNTSGLLQAFVGGILLAEQGSLGALVERKLPVYRASRDAMLERLEAELGDLEGVSWNRPAGGFFLTVDLPFVFDKDCLECCAGEHGVIVCPMSFFSLGGGGERRIRLAFSYVTPDEIAEGVGRLARFIRARTAEQVGSST